MPDVGDKIIFRREQEQIGLTLFAQVEFAKAELELVSTGILNAAFIAAGVIPTPNDGAHQTTLNRSDIGDLRLARMCKRSLSEARILGMRNKRTRGIKDYRGPMLSGPLRLNELAEFVELEERL